jgi:hypothetical protein
VRCEFTWSDGSAAAYLSDGGEPSKPCTPVGFRGFPRKTYRLAAILLESIRREGWLCGNPSGVESPGLMTGLAGIGYGLLRLAEPARVPAVLVLEPPA